MTPSWEIIEHRGPAGLEKLETDWRRLYAAMPARTPFHGYDAFHAYVDHLMADPASLRLIVLTDSTRTRLICPLESRSDRTPGMPVRVWGVPWHPHWPVADVVGPEDDARRAFLPLLAAHMRRTSDGRALLVFGPAAEDSVIWHGLATLEPRTLCVHRTGSPYVFDCRLGYDELMTRLSRHFRKELRRYGRRLGALDGVSAESAHDRPGCARLFEDFTTVESSGWKGHDGTGSAIALHPDCLAFYRALTMHEEVDDRCEINALYAEGHCIAAEFCMHTGNRYTALKIGYDQAYASVSPGHLLGARTLERCCADPTIEQFDQLSVAEWLRVWRPDSMHLRQAHVAVGGLSSLPLIAALRFRHGPGRRIVRRVRRRD